MFFAVRRFLKYSFVGTTTFLLDLALLYFLIEFLSIHYLWATGVAFIVAVSVNYFISRRYVFRGSKRSIKEAYLYFVLIALAGLLIVVSGMYVLVSIVGIKYVFARVIVASVAGFWNYLLNLFINFKVAGKLE